MRLLRGVRSFTDLCSHVYSQTKWQLHSKYISYLVTIYAQHAKNLQKLPPLPFLTCALFLCSPSILPSKFNRLTMTFRKKKAYEKQELKKPCLAGPSGKDLVIAVSFQRLTRLYCVDVTTQGVSFPVKVCLLWVALITCKGMPTIPTAPAPYPRISIWNPKHLEQWIRQEPEKVLQIRKSLWSLEE